VADILDEFAERLPEQPRQRRGRFAGIATPCFNCGSNEAPHETPDGNLCSGCLTAAMDM
jgi:hypothetical protein